MSRTYPKKVVILFAVSELGIALFGFFSLNLFAAVAGLTQGVGHVATGVVAFLLVVIPTTLMGATLSLLVAYMTDRSGNVGRSVSTLYFVNTLGAVAGAFIASSVLLGALGLSSTVQATAVLNAGLGVVVFGMASLERRTT